MQGVSGIRRILYRLGDLVLPRACAVCDRTLGEEDEHCCPSCLNELVQVTGQPYCHRCGLTAEPYLVDENGCSYCKDKPSRFAGIVRVGHYTGPLGKMVRRYKYGRQQRLDRFMGHLMADAFIGQPWTSEIQALVPVPTTFRERLTYGFFPVGLLADMVGRKLGIPVVRAVYARGKRRQQAGLPASARADNVRGIFKVARHNRIRNRTVCVLDDVATSNATMNEMAKVLREAGASDVYAAVLAKASPKPDLPDGSSIP
jgi:ComF family protein